LAAFIVDDVTGKFAGERLCYVCHYGEGPVALVFARRIDEQLAALGGALDGWSDRHPGARAFVTLCSEDPEGDAEELQDLAQAHGLRLPLTLSAEGEFGPHLYRLHPRVPVTVILYREKTVVRNLTAAALTEEFQSRVLAEADVMAQSRGATQTPG
jgi:hypothetical protein